MKSFVAQLTALPTRNLSLYLIGLLAVLCSLAYLHGIKPAYTQLNELSMQHAKSQRLAAKFDPSSLSEEIDRVLMEKAGVRQQMMANIPERALKETLPTLLEQLHDGAKSHRLRTTELTPGEISYAGGIASVPVNMQVTGTYVDQYQWMMDFSETNRGISITALEAEDRPGVNDHRTMSIKVLIYGQ